MGSEERQNAVNLIVELKKKKESLTKEVYMLGVKFDSLTKKVCDLTSLRDRLKKETEGYKGQRREKRKLLKEMLFKFRKVNEKMILQHEEFTNLRAKTEHEVKNIEEAKKEREKTLVSIRGELDVLAEKKASLKDRWLTLSDYQAGLDDKLNEIENGKKAIALDEIRVKAIEDKAQRIKAETERNKELVDRILKETREVHEEAKARQEKAKELEGQAQKEIDTLKGQRLLIEAQEQMNDIESDRLTGISENQERERERISGEWKSVEFMKEHIQNKKLQIMKILHDRGLDDILEMVKEIK